MEVGRKTAGGLALMGLTLDSPIPADVLAWIGLSIGAEHARQITLPE